MTVNRNRRGASVNRRGSDETRGSTFESRIAMRENLSQTEKIRIRNSLSVDRELWIEPFGDFVIVPSGGSVDNSQ